MRWSVLSGIRPSFPGLSRSSGQVPHVILTRSPLIHPVQAPGFSVRLACVKHAASVHPEPGSNSPNKTYCSDHSDQQDRTEHPAPGTTVRHPTEVGQPQQPFLTKMASNKLGTLLSSQTTTPNQPTHPHTGHANQPGQPTIHNQTIMNHTKPAQNTTLNDSCRSSQLDAT